MNSYIFFFTLGFLIDKITLFPFFLGFASGVLFTNKIDFSSFIEKIKNKYNEKFGEEIANTINKLKEQHFETNNQKKTKKQK